MSVLINGIILVLSCQKHMNTRLKEFSLNKNEYDNWKVIYVIAYDTLDNDYELKGNMLYIKCEDSYIHLLKKLVLSIKYLYEIFIIKEGIIRCGDDLIFNENKLIQFINDEKYYFYGKSYCEKDCAIEDINILKNTKNDYFMVKYYKNHPEDLDTCHSLKNINFKKYVKRPAIYGPVGVIYYISNKCCKILIEHMEQINYNVFHYDEFTKSYPYTIEDCGVTFIMYYHKIKFTNNKDFFDTPNSIVKHTNKYK